MIAHAPSRIALFAALGAGLALLPAPGPAAAQPASAAQPAPTPPAAPPGPGPAAAQGLRRMRVIAFEGGSNLALWAAERQGFFEDNGVKMVLTYTPTATAMVTGLADIKFDIGFLAMDHIVAYKEGQGDAKLQNNPDLIALFGVDDGLLTLMSAPAVKKVGDLKRKTASVDALTTGYAFVLRDLLGRAGLSDADLNLVSAGGTSNRYRELIAGKADATLLRTPFELMAKDRGYHALATADALGPYLGTVAATRRIWAQENQAAMVGFIRAYRAGLEWVSDPKNRPVAEAMLVANIRDMTPALAKRSYDVLFAPKHGLIRDLSLDPARIKTVIDLRAKYREGKKEYGPPTKYIEASYREKALEKSPRPSAH
jgi:ABC-type nitrate/sulfonate/bicarbonate transport system substrate-binding protein